MEVRLTYQYKLYQNKSLRKLDSLMEIAAELWNHCIALHRRHYKRLRHQPLQEDR